ncbi:methyltransferase domain-containing protein [Paenibacillus sp. RC84]|uniref:class I SAM-dependent methyltransferase n=1 Tax=Paenibacillus sp. RC84 TaxID=3156252 RepID=UPI0035164692
MQIFGEVDLDQFEIKTKTYNQVFVPYVENMKKVGEKRKEAQIYQTFMDYINIVQWPIRKMEYSFVLDHILNNITKNSTKILDAGCGVTPLPFLLGKYCDQVEAIDYSETDMELMTLLGESREFEGAESVNFSVQDICNLDFEENVFDLICCVSVMEHMDFPNYITALSELYRVLKPGGLLICTMDYWSGESRKYTFGAGGFTTTDLNEIAGFFGNQIENPDSSKLIELSKNDILQFWEKHYDVNVMEDLTREYLAVGFVVKKSLDERVISQTSHNFTNYKIKESMDVVTHRNSLIQTIEMDRKKRLEMINQLHVENKKKDALIEQIEVDREERLNMINQLNIENENKQDYINQIEIDRNNRLEDIILLNEQLLKLQEQFGVVEQDREARLEVIKKMETELLQKNTELNELKHTTELLLNNQSKELSQMREEALVLSNKLKKIDVYMKQNIFIRILIKLGLVKKEAIEV